MRPRILSVTGVGTSPVFPVDWRQISFNVGLQVVVTGSVTYTVQHTMDNVLDPNAPTPTWDNHPTLQSLSATADGSYTSTICAVRLNVTAGTGTAALYIMQQSGEH